MLNLNLKLQSTVAKGQVKTIDLELRKLEALQSAEQISIMKVNFQFSYLSRIYMLLTFI